MERFTIRGLTFTYPNESQKALDDLNFGVGDGEFIVIAGPSGCGKSTLLRHLKTVLAPHGKVSGEILFEGRALAEIGQREQSERIGFVMQNPDNQLVTDKVWHELAFGLESLGYDTPTIRGRVAEMANFFGIQTWFYKDVSELSGGQKQLLNLASIMVMQPAVLILDEPTSQLDPIAAADFLATLGKINRELGTAVIITEHRLEEVLPLCDRVLVMDEGKILCEGTAREVGERLKNCRHGMFLSMPAPMRIYAAVPNGLECPVTVRDGRLWLSELAEEGVLRRTPPYEETEEDPGQSEEAPALELNDVWFKYGKDLPDVLKGLSVKLRRGEFLAVLGGNGTGKTTALSVLTGINRPYRGRVIVEGRELSEHTGLFDGILGVLPQNPQALFVKKTVREDLAEILSGRDLNKEEKEKKLKYVSRLCRLEELLYRHPYDLSGGEQQRAALAKVLLLEPRILLLDEPTKGLDSEFKQIFAEILGRLLGRGVAVLMVSHDIEFCAKHAHRCAMFFDGRIVTEDSPRAFFSGNSFYTTAANRMARHLLPGAVTAEDVIEACGGDLPEKPQLPSDDDCEYLKAKPDTAEEARKRLPLWRIILACAAGAISFVLMLISLYEPDIPLLMGKNKLGLYISLIFTALVLAAAISKREERPIENEQVSKEKRRLSKRTAAAAFMILLAIPLTIFIGVFYLGDRKYYFISMLIVLETMLPFFLIFEGRKPQARELVIISVLCAIGVAGRAAFFMLPQFKPVAAIVIISGVAFGGETGFLVGAVTMLVSNVMFGQGPWTPWQMFAMGIIGFLAGVLFRKGLLRRSSLPLCVFGALSTIIIYGGLMNPSFVIVYNSHPTWPMFLTAYLMGFPFDLIHGLATFFFLLILSRPMLEKLDRIKVKYGLVESGADEAPARAAVSQNI